MSKNIEIRIASIGNVDSAKSTTISCISNDILDDGRGSARKYILKHPHEKKTGRTSSVTQYYVNKNKKTFGFVDLAGHEKYLKTTMSGLSGCFIDYAMVTIGGDRGIIGMTKEHMGIAIALKIPMFIVLTKIDISPKHKLDKILQRTIKIMSSKAAGQKICKVIRDGDDIGSLIDWNDKNICPIFLTSNTLGTNLINLKHFVYSLKSNTDWIRNTNNKIFTIDDVYKVRGIGVVVSGFAKEGNITTGDQIYLGPFNGKFKLISIKSIHNNFHENIETLYTGMNGCINIKPVNTKKDFFIKEDIKKGMIVILNPKCIREFEAEILVLKHPTTIRSSYQPVIHCGSIRQAAKIRSMDKELIRTGDTANVTFEFLFHPEFIEPDSQLIFREGNTRGVGKVIKVKHK